MFEKAKAQKALDKVRKLEYKAKLALYQEDKNKYYEKAFNLLWNCRTFAYPELDYTLGKYYYNGLYVEENIDEAVMWFKRAADFDFAPAMYALFELYRVKYDIPEALDWILKAEERGHYMSKEDYDFIGQCFEDGDGCDLDLYSAIAYYEKAKALGSHFAMSRLQQWKVVDGVIYYTGY